MSGFWELEVGSHFDLPENKTLSPGTNEQEPQYLTNLLSCVVMVL